MKEEEDDDYLNDDYLNEIEEEDYLKISKAKVKSYLVWIVGIGITILVIASWWYK
jgi:hypothetical protein